MWVPLGATGAAFLADFSAFGQAIALKSLIADTKLSLAKVEVAGSNPVSRFHIPNAAEPQPNREDAFPPRAFSNQLSAPLTRGKLRWTSAWCLSARLSA